MLNEREFESFLIARARVAVSQTQRVKRQINILAYRFDAIRKRYYNSNRGLSISQSCPDCAALFDLPSRLMLQYTGIHWEKRDAACAH